MFVRNLNIKQFYLTQKIGPYQDLPLQVRVDPKSNGNKGLLHNPQNSKTGASPTDCLMSYSRHSLGESYPQQRCSRCILQSQLKGLNKYGFFDLAFFVWETSDTRHNMNYKGKNHPKLREVLLATRINNLPNRLCSLSIFTGSETKQKVLRGA